MRAREMISEDTGGRLLPIDGHKVVNYHGRMMVLADLGPARIPFYLSTGGGGKKKVPAGRWYPFFGIGPDGWINKTSQTDMVNYYYNPKLRAVAQALDAKLGDIRRDTRFPEVTAAGIQQINSGLEPLAYGSDMQFLYKLLPLIKRALAPLGGTEAKGQGDPMLAKIDGIAAAFRSGKMDWKTAVDQVQAMPDPKTAVDYFLFHAAPVGK